MAIDKQHLLPNHHPAPLYATVPKAEYDALKRKLDICQKECIRIAELYQRDKQLFNTKIQRIIRHINYFKKEKKMQIQLNDVKEIVNKVKQGGGSNYTPLEIELAKMVVRYRQTIGRLEDEKSKMFDKLYKIYNAIHSTEFAADLMHKHATVLAGNSKAHFAQAVKLDNQLKEFINNGSSENKDG